MGQQLVEGIGLERTFKRWEILVQLYTENGSGKGKHSTERENVTAKSLNRREEMVSRA